MSNYSFKNQAGTKPYAMGTLLQNSAYGSTIPVVYGQTLSGLLAIWAANHRQGGGSTKKFKQIKKGITNYCENIDFLLGHSPIMGVLQLGYNSGWFPLEFTSQSFDSVGGRQNFSVTDSNFYFVTAVTLTASYSFPVNDYGGTGPQTLTGTFEIPLWNELENGPDPVNAMSYRAWPYSYRWQPSFGAEIFIDAYAFPTGTLKVYYAAVTPASSSVPPITHLDMVFENLLGSGPEYADAPSPFDTQQIIYPHFAGLGSSELNLGATGVLPAINPEVRGKWGIYSAGDADFVDMIEDIFKSGMAQAAINGDPGSPQLPANTQMERGLSSYDLPGMVQKKPDLSLTLSVPPMLYDMATTPGNGLVVICVSAGTLSISDSLGNTFTPVFSGSGLGYQVWVAITIGGPDTVTISGATGPFNAAIIEVGGPGGGSSPGKIDTVVQYLPEALFNGIKTGESSAGPYFAIAALMSDFTIPTLPGTAGAIQGIYPVFLGGFFNFNTIFWQDGEDNPGPPPPVFEPAGTPTVNVVVGTGVYSDGTSGYLYGETYALDGPAPVGTSVSGQWNGLTSIGTSLSDITGQIIGAEIARSGNTNPGGSYGSQPVCAFQTVFAGFCIYYDDPVTPGSNPGDGPLPFPIPAGQSVVWSFPDTIEGNIPGGSPTFGSLDLPVSFSLPIPPPATYSASIDTTVQQGFPAYLMAIPIFIAGGAPGTLAVPQWKPGAQPNVFGNSPPQFQIQYRNVYSPGTYKFPYVGPTPDATALISFKWANPVPWPRPLGDFIDIPSFDQVRRQCRAGGLFGSLAMNSQSSAQDWIKSLCDAADCAPVFLGQKLYLYPYSEASAAGNGALFTASTAAGPVAALSDLNGDYVGEDGTPLLTPADRIELPNVLQMQCLDRNANYNQVTVQTPDPATLGLYGVRKADPVTQNAVQDPTIARTLLGIMVRRQQYGGDSWAFKASARSSLLSPMDLITLTDTLQNLYAVPVRITSYNEQDDGSFEGTAEPFIYGMSAPSLLAGTTPTQNTTNVNLPAGNINTPIIFEPTPGLYPGLSGGQLWCVASSPSDQYGGCQVLVSTDGGSSYNPAPGGADGDSNVILGQAVTGELTADWPAAYDPDTTNNLLVDVAETYGGVIESITASARDNFELPCYVQESFAFEVNGTAVAAPALGTTLNFDVNGTAVATMTTLDVNGTPVAESTESDGFGYELMAYAAVTLTSPSNYTLLATGAGNELRRSILDAPSLTGAGVQHAAGSRFAVLAPSGMGILKIAMPAIYIGQELFFKFLSFNTFGAALENLAEVPAYSYTPTGVPGSV